MYAMTDVRLMKSSDPDTASNTQQRYYAGNIAKGGVQSMQPCGDGKG